MLVCSNRYINQQRVGASDLLVHDTESHAATRDKLPALAAYFETVIEGMSVQDLDGADRSQLLQVAELAMRAWPT